MAQYTGNELIELTDDELQAVAGGNYYFGSYNNNSFNGGNVTQTITNSSNSGNVFANGGIINRSFNQED